jgi:hypothetical protein
MAVVIRSACTGTVSRCWKSKRAASAHQCVGAWSASRERMWTLAASLVHTLTACTAAVTAGFGQEDCMVAVAYWLLIVHQFGLIGRFSTSQCNDFGVRLAHLLGALPPGSCLLR